MKARDAEEAAILVKALADNHRMIMMTSDSGWVGRLTMGPLYPEDNNFGVKVPPVQVIVDCTTLRAIARVAESIIRQRLEELGVEL